MIWHLAENVEKTTICELKFNEANVKHFKEAIDDNYWFEFFMGTPSSLFFFLLYLNHTFLPPHSYFSHIFFAISISLVSAALEHKFR